MNGYDYAVQKLGRDCGDLANERLSIFEKTAVWEGSFEQLRCCLFFEQRRWRHFGIDPEGNALLKYRSYSSLYAGSGGASLEVRSIETRMYLEINGAPIALLGVTGYLSKVKVYDPARLHNISNKIFANHSLVER